MLGNASGEEYFPPISPLFFLLLFPLHAARIPQQSACPSPQELLSTKSHLQMRACPWTKLERLVSSVPRTTWRCHLLSGDRRVSAQKTHLGNRRPATGRKNGRNAAARKAPQSVRPSSLPGRCPHVGSPLTSSLHATLSNTPHRDRTGIIQLLSSALQAKIDIYKKNFSHHSGLPFYCLKSKMTKTYLPFY